MSGNSPWDQWKVGRDEGRYVVNHYDKEGVPNPYLDLKLDSLNLPEREIDALAAFMEALDGEGYQDVSPALFPE